MAICAQKGRPRVIASHDTSRHICLVTPGHLSTDPRLVKEAEAFLQAGCVVTVITGRYLGWAIEADSVYRNHAWTHIEVPFGPSSSLYRWAWQTAVRRSCHFLGRLLRWRFLRISELGVHPAVPSLQRACRRVRADFFLAHNLAALPAAGRAASRQGVPFGFDAEDDHVEELPDDLQNESERKLRDRLMSAYLPKAAFLSAASPMIADSMSGRYNRPFVAIPNVFPLSYAAACPTPSVIPLPRFYWFSQTIGPNRGLEEVLRIIAQMRTRVRLCLRGSVSPGYRERLCQFAGSISLTEESVEWLPIVPPNEVVEACSGYALGLSTEIPDVRNHAICLGNKIFAYLLAGTPVLLSKTPAQSALAEELGEAALLIDLNRPAEAASILDDWLADEGLRRRASTQAWRLARERYNWDVLKQSFVTQVLRTIAPVDSGATPIGETQTSAR